MRVHMPTTNLPNIPPDDDYEPGDGPLDAADIEEIFGNWPAGQPRLERHNYEARFGYLDLLPAVLAGMVYLCLVLLNVMLASLTGLDWAPTPVILLPSIIGVGLLPLVLAGVVSRYARPRVSGNGLNWLQRMRRSVGLSGQSAYEYMVTHMWTLVTFGVIGVLSVASSITVAAVHDATVVHHATATARPSLSAPVLTQRIAAQQEEHYRQHGHYTTQLPGVARGGSNKLLTLGATPQLRVLGNGDVWVLKYRGQLVVHRRGQPSPNTDVSQRTQLN